MMKRKFLTSLLVVIMAGTMLIGCGSKNETSNQPNSNVTAENNVQTEKTTENQVNSEETVNATVETDEDDVIKITTESGERIEIDKSLETTETVKNEDGSTTYTTEDGTEITVNEDGTATVTPAPTETPTPTPTETPAPTETPQPSHSHSYSSKVTKEATCTSTGVKTYTCSCGDSYMEDIAKVNHVSGDWTVTKTATCKETGTKVKTCTVCGTQLDSTTIAKVGHAESGWVTVTEATCSSNGLKHKTCTVCGVETASETIVSSGSHSYYWDGDNSTRTHKCSGCNYVGITEYNYNGAWGYYDDNAANVLWGYVNNQRNKTETIVRDELGNPIEIINVASLVSSGDLNAKAKNRAVEAATNFSHGSNTDECLAWGQGSPEAAMDAWGGSYSHMKALTNPDYVYGGIACFYFDSDNSGINLTPIWVLELGR